jgi:hypothetical protein
VQTLSRRLGDVQLEKFYAYSRLLLSKLPKKDITERLKLNDEDRDEAGARKKKKNCPSSLTFLMIGLERSSAKGIIYSSTR